MKESASSSSSSASCSSSSSPSTPQVLGGDSNCDREKSPEEAKNEEISSTGENDDDGGVFSAELKPPKSITGES